MSLDPDVWGEYANFGTVSAPPPVENAERAEMLELLGRTMGLLARLSDRRKIKYRQRLDIALLYDDIDAAAAHFGWFVSAADME